ncbi:MAG: hypothetical protein ACK4ZZ_21400, partial [Microcystis sp.]
MSGIVIPSVYQDFALLRWFIGSLGQEPQRDKGHKDRSLICKLRDLRFDNVPFGRTQFAPTLWTKSVTVGAQSLRPPIDWDIIPT